MKHNLEIERILDTQIEKVWQSITKGDQMRQWMIPNGFVSSYTEYNFHLGGQYRAGMRDQKGEEYFIVGSYLNIVEPGLLEFSHAWEDAEGTPGEETKVTIQLISDGPSTKLIFRQEGFSSAERAAGHRAGWEECLDKLQNLVVENDDYDKEIAKIAEPLPHTTPIKTEVLINSSIATLWEAFSEPDIVLKWWGPKNYSSPACEIDFRVGGKYLFAMEDQDGNINYNTGTYQEIQPGRKIVYTDSFGDENGTIVSPSVYGLTNYPNECLITVYFSNHDGQTVLSITQSGITDPEVRDNVRSSWQESLTKLKDLLENNQD